MLEKSVQIQATLMQEMKITFEVPQVTVLGPMLFNVHIIELLCHTMMGHVDIYADDTAIIYSGATWNDVIIQ